MGAESALAIVPKAKSADGGLRKKVLGELGGKELSELLAEKKSGMPAYDAAVEEATALEQAVAKQVASAQQEFDKARTDVTASIEAETKAAEKMKGLKSKKAELSQKTTEGRKALLEA